MTNSDTCCNHSTSIWILAGTVTIRLMNWKVKVSLEERCENHDYLYNIILHCVFRRVWTTGRSSEISAMPQEQDRVTFPQCHKSKIASHFRRAWTGRSRDISAMPQEQDRMTLLQSHNWNKITWFPQRLNKRKITWHIRRAWTGRSRDISAMPQEQDRVTYLQCLNNSKIAWHYCKATIGTRSRGFPQSLNKSKITWHFCNGAKVWSLAISAVPEQQQYHMTILQWHNWNKITCVSALLNSKITWHFSSGTRARSCDISVVRS
jgi:hypothetical protein